MSTLNYKKPAFWAAVVVVIAVAAIVSGILTDRRQGTEMVKDTPMVKDSAKVEDTVTIEDYANQFIQQEINHLESFETSDYKIVDSKITKLEKIGTYDSFLSYPLEIWRLEYRLKPDDISKVMLAGGMNEINGWITEDSSMGKPMLVFSFESSEPEYLGCIRHGEYDFTTIAGQETALRVFLEAKELLPPVTYPGNHIVVKFPLSTGETCQLLLSQPAEQGDSGIWCVERWMDGNGSVYHVTPNTDGRIFDYFRDLKNESDKGLKPWLKDPLQVALEWINNDLGQRVTIDELVPMYSASVEDFLASPESNFIGYISNFEIDKPRPSFHLDQIEWLTLDDAERLKELNIDPDDLPNGFYIHNPDNYPMYCQVTEKTQFIIIDLGDEVTQKSVTVNEFFEYLKQYTDYSPPFRIITKDGYVKSVTEQYVP